MKSEFLRASINRGFNEGAEYLTPKFLRQATGGDWGLVHLLVTEWQKGGYIEVLKELQVCGENEACVKILKRIPDEVDGSSKCSAILGRVSR